MFYAALAQGEALVQDKLVALAAAAGMDRDAVAAHRPLAGCQAYPSYLCRLAHHADPADVVPAITANFAAWGGYCARIGVALRRHYGFTDEQCAFFDFFAEPAHEVEELAHQAVHVARADIDRARVSGYGLLLQDYELMFWNTLADAACAGTMITTAPGRSSARRRRPPVSPAR